MKLTNFLKSMFLTVCIFVLQNKSLSQDSVTLADADKYYRMGLISFNKNDYENSINYFLISLRMVEKPLTYYVLSHAFAKQGNFKSANLYADIALKSNPPLTADYRDGLIQIKAWADKQIKLANEQNKPQHAPDNFEVTSNADQGYRPSPDVPMPPAVVNPFVSTAYEKYFVFPGSGKQVGVFENAGVLDNNNNQIGYIQFHGYYGKVKHLGNGRESVSSFLIFLNGATDTGVNSTRISDKISYSMNELYRGSVKYKKVDNYI